MTLRRIAQYFRILCAIACLACCSVAAASEYHGQVTFGGLPVPGATVVATQGDKKLTAVTDQQGVYSFPDLADGTWTVEVEMTGFSTVKQDVVIAPNAAATTWDLKLLPLDQIKAQITSIAPVTSAASPPAGVASQTGAAPAKPTDNKAPEVAPPQQDVDQRASDGLLINGSVNNGAASPFAQMPAFGNSRFGGRRQYNGNIGLNLNNSALDASPFSLSGVSTPKPQFNQTTGFLDFGGPLKIPHVLRNGPYFIVGYRWTRDANDATVPALVPTMLERSGNLSQTLNTAGQPVQFVNPATGQPFAGNMVPVSPQAQALLNLYPMPNLAGNAHYNYQVPIVSDTHQDALSARLQKSVGRRDGLSGTFAFRSTRTSNPSLFGFLDTNNSLGLNAQASWRHSFGSHLIQTAGYQFTRLATQNTPYWENRANVSGDAGITGNNQDPMNWGPPTLAFSGGLASLSDAQSSHNRNQTGALSYSMLWIHRDHNVTFGGDFRRQEFNYLSQQDARGEFTFTGAATQGIVNGVPVGGSDLADFLLGVPDASTIAYGNADKYLRESVYDAYVSDDWRVLPQLTLDAGVRWEYGAPITELYNRLVNLDIASGFSAVAPVVATNPVGPLTGQAYPNSLIRPDKHGVEPRIGIAWRPLSGSSMVVRAGYGIYYDTSVYQALALQMAQQAPLSKSLSLQNSAACPLTLADGFSSCPLITPDNFAIDPNFHVGYAQNWQLAVQRDLPWSLQMVATYLGIKGTRGMQEVLPNTFPIGASNPCPTCPTGFTYLTSNGNSNREAGEFQLRRRLHSGLTASAQYTFSKSLDDDSVVGGQGPIGSSAPGSGAGGGAATSPGIAAQNWLNPRGEYSLSSFDQRHLLTTALQYTTGMGLGGGTLLEGWRGVLFKQWTFLTQITVGSGLPETPVYLAAVEGTGVTGTIRPDYTGAALYAAPAGSFLNPQAYAAPAPGQWGDAGRNSITGPSQFSMDASMARTFQLKDRLHLDVELQSTNILNHVTYTGFNTTWSPENTQFGLPTSPNQMRTVQTTLRLGF